MFNNIVAITAGLAATTSAFTCTGNYFSFYNRGGDALSYQRLDPALYPGTQSPHLHSFDGASGLSASTDYAEAQGSSCTTARIKTDKSLYWRPTLFWNGNGTGFYRVPEQSTKIYYKYGDGDKWANVTGFPEDFNMIAGDPMKRSDGDNPAGVRWGCHNPDGRDDKIFANGFPTGFQSCDYGFATEVTFPSCWNGQKLDPKSPSAHMAYPTGAGGIGIENCPTTHRAARFPTIFVEFWYDISSFKGQYGSNSSPWALSNGDPTGFGFHADFLNGWEKGVLEKATAQTGGCNCGCGCGQAEMETCFGSENVNKNEDAAWNSCKAQGASSSDASPVLETLPGCNPLQSGPARATVVTGAGCSATAAPVSGDNKSSAVSYTGASKTSATYSPVVTSSAGASSAAAISSMADVNPSSVVKDDTPLLSMSLPNKQVSGEYGPTSVVKASASATPAAAFSSLQYGAAPSGGYNATSSSLVATPKGTPASPALPSLSLANTAVPAGSTSKPSSGSPSGGKDENCKAPVYVTVTPTIYVTAGVVNSTPCGLGTVTKTLTQTATITLPAQGGMEYGSY